MRIHVEYNRECVDLDDERFVIEHVATIFEHTADDEEVCVGRVWFDRVLALSAISAGRPLEDVCDGSSQGLYHCYQILYADSEDDGFVSPELGGPEPVHELVLIHDAVWHPVSTVFQPAFVYELGELLDCHSIIFAWRKAFTAADADLRTAGLMRIYGEPDALYRLNVMDCELSKAADILPVRPLPIISEVVKSAPLAYVDDETRRRHG